MYNFPQFSIAFQQFEPHLKILVWIWNGKTCIQCNLHCMQPHDRGITVWTTELHVKFRTLLSPLAMSCHTSICSKCVCSNDSYWCQKWLQG